MKPTEDRVRKSKETGDKSGNFAKGGKTKMFPMMHAGPQNPGGSEPGGYDKNGSKFAASGNAKDVGAQHAGPQEEGVSGHVTKGDGGKFAKGGTTHMFGRQTASTATPGSSVK